MDDTSGIEHQPREGAEANVCGFSTVYFVSKALDGMCVWYAIEGGFMLDRDRRCI